MFKTDTKNKAKGLEATTLANMEEKLLYAKYRKNG